MKELKFMKLLKLRIDGDNPKHIRFTVFQDGGNCGHLTMDREAYFQLEKVLMANDEFPVVVDNKSL